MREADVAFAESGPLLQSWRGDRNRVEHRPRGGRRQRVQAPPDARPRRALAARRWSRSSSSASPKLAQESLPQRASGTLRDEWFRTYLGGMALYAAGLGFITAGKFVAAARMLTLAYSDGHQRRERFVVAFTRHLHELADLVNSGQPTRQHVPFSELMLKCLHKELGALSPGPTAFETAPSTSGNFSRRRSTGTSTT